MFLLMFQASQHTFCNMDGGGALSACQGIPHARNAFYNPLSSELCNWAPPISHIAGLQIMEAPSSDPAVSSALTHI